MKRFNFINERFIMKRLMHLLLFALLAAALHAQQAKYVFYFIGDGMGVNQVNGAEMYQAALDGRIGAEGLLFTTFPAAGVATTYSASNPITDSAAAGTALSTGAKTCNNAIGVDTGKNALASVAERAKHSGKRVGIATSVSIDHATPAAFYAHQPGRGMYYEIALDLPKSGFDFFAGSGFLKPGADREGGKAPSVFRAFAEAGYAVARGLDEYKAKAAGSGKLILIQAEGADPACLPYAIDRKEGDLALAEITRSAIDFLAKGGNDGFFLMVEGGKIDWACHGNDPATAFNEVKDLDNAVRAAYEFYLEHPKETLIVITADHETGGLGLGREGYQMNLKYLALQRQSQEALSALVSGLRASKGSKAGWEEAKRLLGETMGFWDEIPVTWEQEKMLRDAYEETFAKGKGELERGMYAGNEPLAAAARRVMSQQALVGWTTAGHTAGLVPVYAVGAGASLFNGRMDNTDIPKNIIKAARYK